MKEKDDQLFWKYIDRTISEAERAELEQRRAQDPTFRLTLAEREELHRQLRKTTAEQPSLRFVRNVMDKLPAIYRRTLEPLVRPFWIKAFFGGLGLVLLSYFVMVAYYVQERPLDQQDQVVSLANRVGKLILGLPQNLFTVIAALSTGFLLLMLLDRYLKGRTTRVNRQ